MYLLIFAGSKSTKNIGNLFLLVLFRTLETFRTVKLPASSIAIPISDIGVDG